MGMEKDEVFKKLTLRLPDWLDEDEREEAMEEIGEFLLSELLDHVAKGISPVTGKPFAKLSEGYAQEEKLGDNKPNLDLNGSMMDAIEYRIEGNTIMIGIWDDDQAVKAYGHNTGFEGHPFLEGKAPARKFIPNEKENFTKDIMDGYKDLLEDLISEFKERDQEDIG